jgi:hypothetical protein
LTLLCDGIFWEIGIFRFIRSLTRAGPIIQASWRNVIKGFGLLSKKGVPIGIVPNHKFIT